MRFATDYLTREANKSYRLNGWLIIASLLFLWLQTVTYPPHLVVVWWVGTTLWSWNLVFNTLLLLRILRRRRAARDVLRTLNR